MPVRVPPQSLEAATLEAVLEEIVTRDSTDYGDTPVSVDSRREQLRRRLDSGEAALVFDEESATLDVVPAEHAPREPTE
ncbi:MAG: YheU family protein [Thiohalospira sp.]